MWNRKQKKKIKLLFNTEENAFRHLFPQSKQSDSSSLYPDIIKPGNQYYSQRTVKCIYFTTCPVVPQFLPKKDMTLDLGSSCANTTICQCLTTQTQKSCLQSPTPNCCQSQSTKKTTGNSKYHRGDHTHKTKTKQLALNVAYLIQNMENYAPYRQASETFLDYLKKKILLMSQFVRKTT